MPPHETPKPRRPRWAVVCSSARDGNMVVVGPFLSRRKADQFLKRWRKDNRGRCVGLVVRWCGPKEWRLDAPE
jgi:hypothetical protein